MQIAPTNSLIQGLIYFSVCRNMYLRENYIILLYFIWISYKYIFYFYMKYKYKIKTLKGNWERSHQIGKEYCKGLPGGKRKSSDVMLWKPSEKSLRADVASHTGEVEDLCCKLWRCMTIQMYQLWFFEDNQNWTGSFKWHLERCLALCKIYLRIVS